MATNEIIFELHEEPKGGYSATATSHAIFNQGDNWEELKANIQDATRLYFEGEAEVRSVARLLLRREETLAVA